MCEGDGTQGPWRRGATGCCKLSRQLPARYEWTVACVGLFVSFVALLDKPVEDTAIVLVDPKEVAAACGTPSSRPSAQCSSWDSATPMTECHAQEKVTSDFLHESRSNGRISEQRCCMEEVHTCVTRHHMCANTFVLCRLENLSCLPQHAAEVDLEGSVRQTWLIHRTQMWMLIRPRSPHVGEKGFCTRIVASRPFSNFGIFMKSVLSFCGVGPHRPSAGCSQRESALPRVSGYPLNFGHTGRRGLLSHAKLTVPTMSLL